VAVDESDRTFHHPLFDYMESVPGLDLATTTVDKVLSWGQENALWIFPMATSCCGIEFMAAAASRVDLDRMGTIVRGTPRHSDVMVVAGTITVKMAPRVKKLWEQMPEPKWCLAMGSCAISGDFYRDIYSVVPGVDTFLPVDVYVPGCPPNPEALMHGMMRLQEKIRAVRSGAWRDREPRPETPEYLRRPSIPRLDDANREPITSAMQVASAGGLGKADTMNLVQIRRRVESDFEGSRDTMPGDATPPSPNEDERTTLQSSVAVEPSTAGEKAAAEDTAAEPTAKPGSGDSTPEEPK
jgi:NADH-quinone oxidoreductase subunit B